VFAHTTHRRNRPAGTGCDGFGPPGELLTLLDQHSDAETVMLVGHNPGIERLVALLVEGRSDEFRGMPPGALAVLHLNGALEPGNARLDAFWSP
jgi:phosphohistidine phosphatase